MCLLGAGDGRGEQAARGVSVVRPQPCCVRRCSRRGCWQGPGCWRDAAGWLHFFPGLCLSFSLFFVFLFPIKSALSHFLHEKQGSFSEMNSSSSSKAPACAEK